MNCGEQGGRGGGRLGGIVFSGIFVKKLMFVYVD